MKTVTLLAILALPFASAPSLAQTLTPVEEIDWELFRADGLRLIASATSLDLGIPAETLRKAQKLLEPRTPANPPGVARAVQELLDPHCLIGIHINPESRVKAARGPVRAELVLDQPRLVLARIHNEAGVTQGLSVRSEQAVLSRAKPEPGRWLEVSVVDARPFANRLSGGRVEYRVMKLTPRQAGKREATLAFDVGQGTQDLGFRAEVPILFSIRPK